MFKPNSNAEPVEVLTQPEQRRRRSVEEKLAIVRETFEPGATVSGVARRHQVNANQVFAWRKLYQDGSLSAVSSGEQVVPASDLAEAIKDCPRGCGHLGPPADPECALDTLTGGAARRVAAARRLLAALREV